MGQDFLDIQYFLSMWILGCIKIVWLIMLIWQSSTCVILKVNSIHNCRPYVLGASDVNANLYCNSRTSVLRRLRDSLRLLMKRSVIKQFSPSPIAVIHYNQNPYNLLFVYNLYPQEVLSNLYSILTILENRFLGYTVFPKTSDLFYIVS